MKKERVSFDDQLDLVATQQEEDESVLTTGSERNGKLIFDTDSGDDKPYKRMESYMDKEDDEEKEYSEESGKLAQKPNDGEESSPEEISQEGETGGNSEYDFEEALKQQFSKKEKGMQHERYINILVHYFILNICVTFSK